MSTPGSAPDPYAPPSTREHVPERVADKDRILCWLGALSLAYAMVRTFWFQDTDTLTFAVGMLMFWVCISGFLRGGRKFHLGIALWMGLMLWVQGYFVNRAIELRDQLPVDIGPHPWRDFVLGSTPFIIALLCGFTLYVRARGKKPAGG